MIKKSPFLEYILGRARELAGKSPNANHFVASVLEALVAGEARLPEEVKCKQTKDELAAIRSSLDKYSVDINGALGAIRAYLKQNSGKSSLGDDISFDLVIAVVEKNARDGNIELVDAAMYFDMILTKPTSAIKECIIRDPEVKPVSDLSFEKWFSMSSSDDKDDKEKAPSKADESSSGDELEEKLAKSKEMPSLSELVKTTREIQTTLLDSVFGQDRAVSAFVSGYFQSRLMASSRGDTTKPQATFLFAGPPGVGKTFLAEKAAEALGKPFKRFDMSEYASPSSHHEFCGTPPSYQAASEGAVTGFVEKNPHCVLLFDEIEKAHINVIHLFLQMLDAGHLTDNNTSRTVSFTNAVIILTTNAGKNLYSDPGAVNLSSLPRKKVLKALESDVNPATGEPLFPAAICSRFASGNVVMFNHLEASNLYNIAKRELSKNVEGLEAATGITINVDDKVASAIMFAEGGKADARTVKGRANSFFYDELYELFRLLPDGDSVIEGLSEINVTVPAEELSGDTEELFDSRRKSEVLVFSDKTVSGECKRRLGDKVLCHTADNLAAAKEILFNHDIDLIISDVSFNARRSEIKVLNAEDIDSEGRDFILYVLEKYSLPVYVLEQNKGDITKAELLSFARLGVRDVLTLKGERGEFAEAVLARCKIAYQQSKMNMLARENRAMSYKTAQTVSSDGSSAEIRLFGFKLSLITDTEDSDGVLDDLTRPNVRFDDVIGAEGAKDELKYFVQYLRNPIEYLRRGVRAPRGVLLYGPPGTGKTLLAKAMAGESGVTFIRAEGNQFLKRFVGEGPESVHSLFKTARKYAPSIVFIDEIDAVGKNRDSISDSSSTGDILTALLTEMDGFNTDTTKPVFVLAATNYGVEPGSGKSLDAALLRRFDRRIYVDLPNREERKHYIKMKLGRTGSVALSEEQIDNIAMRSTGMSLAELESVFEMALRSAIRTESGTVGDAEFEEAFETFNSGEKREWSRDSLIRTARHEAGHALICWLTGEKPAYVTVVSRGDHGGYMQHGGGEDKGSYTKAELLGRIRTALGGRAAEIVYYGAVDGISTGASGDLRSATHYAEHMICSYGMYEEIGLGTLPVTDRPTAEVRGCVNTILSEELREAIKVIEANRSAIDRMVELLLEKNHLKEREIDELLSATVKTV